MILCTIFLFGGNYYFLILCWFLLRLLGAHKRLITSPPVAVFPHPLATDLTFPRFLKNRLKSFMKCWYTSDNCLLLAHLILMFMCRYWNYLRKQTFVLESYTTKVNWIMNRALFTSHCYLSWGFVSPYIMAGIHVAAALRHYLKENSLEGTAMTCNGEYISLV